jgi:hypothetical protein
MVKNFTRTITTTKVTASKINLETLAPVAKYEMEEKEDLTKEDIIKTLIKKNGKPSLTEAYVVNEMVKTNITYSMTMEDFFKYAKVVPAKEPKKEEPKKEETKKSLNEKNGKDGK